MGGQQDPTGGDQFNQSETKVRDMQRRWENLGYTLVETIIVTVLVSIIFTTVALYYQTAFGIWERGNNQTEVQQQARIVLTKLVSDLQQTKFLRFRPRGTVSWRELPADFALKLQEGPELLLCIPPGEGQEQDLQVRYYFVDHSLIRSTGGHNPIAMYIDSLALRLDEEAPLVSIELVAAMEGVEARMVTSTYLRNLRGAGD